MLLDDRLETDWHLVPFVLGREYGCDRNSHHIQLLGQGLSVPDKHSEVLAICGVQKQLSLLAIFASAGFEIPDTLEQPDNESMPSPIPPTSPLVRADRSVSPDSSDSGKAHYWRWGWIDEYAAGGLTVEQLQQT